MWLLIALLVLFAVGIAVMAIASDRTGGTDDLPFD